MLHIEDVTLRVAGRTLLDAASIMTGSAYPRLADETFDRSKGWGWFVGWATLDDRTVVFARLIQDERRKSVSGVIRARDQLLQQWDGISAGF